MNHKEMNRVLVYGFCRCLCELNLVVSVLTGNVKGCVSISILQVSNR